MPWLSTLQMYGRFVLGLPRFLRRQQVTVDEAKAAVRRDLAARNGNFLTLARRAIFENPRSPYRPLLRLAGCELGDIESAVRNKGLEATLEDLRLAQCDILTLGQYLQPTLKHLPVAQFFVPEKFAELGERARAMGFLHVASGPMVRSSYHADDFAAQVLG